MEADRREPFRIVFQKGILRGMDTLSREATLFSSLLRGICSKRKEFATHGSKFFLFREEPFSEQTGSYESFLPCNKWQKKKTTKLPSVSGPLKIMFWQYLNPFMPSGLFHLTSLDRSISYVSSVWLVFIITIFCRNFYI